MYDFVNKYRITLVGVCVAIVVMTISLLVFTLVQDEEPTEHTEQTTVTVVVPTLSKEYLDCVDGAAKRLQAMPGVDISKEQAYSQAENSPRCSPLKTDVFN